MKNMWIHKIKVFALSTYGTKEMSRIQEEMKEILAQEKESQSLLENAFKGIGYGID